MEKLKIKISGTIRGGVLRDHLIDIAICMKCINECIDKINEIVGFINDKEKSEEEK